MRKTSKKTIIGGLVALSLILTGTGYAYWTNTLNINTKATTGDLDVTFGDLGLIAQYGDETIKGWSIVDGIGTDKAVLDDFFGRGTQYNKIAKDGSINAYKERAKGYHEVDFNAELKDAVTIKKTVGPYNSGNTNTSDTINLTINKMYPGYAQAFRTDILNVGSLAAKLGNIKFNVGKSEGVTSDMLGIALYLHSELNPSNPSNRPVFKLAKDLGLAEEDYFTVGGVDFVRLSSLSKVNDDRIKNALINNTILTSPATENRMDLYIGVAMDPDKDGKYTTGSSEKLNTSNKDADSQLKAVDVTIDFIWDQFNAGADAGTANILKEQNRDAKSGGKP